MERKQKESIKRPPCEFIARRIVPVVRSRLATMLVEEKELSQEEVAKLFGVSQATISYYTRSKRGKTLENEELARVVDELVVEQFADILEDTTASAATFCKLCKKLRDEEVLPERKEEQ